MTKYKHKIIAALETLVNSTETLTVKSCMHNSVTYEDKLRINENNIDRALDVILECQKDIEQLNIPLIETMLACIARKYNLSYINLCYMASDILEIDIKG